MKKIYKRFFKRGLDVGFVLAASPILIPVIAVSALLVKLDGGPAFYSQDRIGRGGRVFKIWKLRSMVENADEKLKELLEADEKIRTEWQIFQKLKNDPRITWIGKILRKYSIDELPQFWNVFKGDMSVVGPRPMMVNQADMYAGSAYYDVKPGITGSWQVYCRNQEGFDSRVRYDEDYVAKLCLLTDMAIIIRTLPAMVAETAA